MVIKKLNKFFHDHSRVIFGIFAILIILAFTEIPMGGAGCDDPADTVVGTVYGENVTAGELQQLHRDFTLYNTLLNNPVSNIDFQTLLELKAWLKRAGQLGVVYTAEESAEAIKNSPLFFDGKFSQAKYDDFLKERAITHEIFVAQLRNELGASVTDDRIVDILENQPQFMDGKFSMKKYDEFLKERGLTDADVKEVMSKFGVLGKIRDVFMNSAVVSDDEVKSYYQMRKRGAELEIATFKAADPAKITVDDKALKAFYEKNKDYFQIPGSYSVLCAVIPVAKFEKQAEKAVTATMIEKARKLHPGKKDDELKKMLAAQQVNVLASSEASRIARECYDKIDGKLPVADQLKLFREWGADNGLAIVEKNDQPLRSYDQMAAAVQQLPAAGLQLLSGQFPVDNGIAIVMLKGKTAAKPMTFEQAKADKLADMYKQVVPYEQLTEKIDAELKKVNALSGEAKVKAFKALPGAVFKTVKYPMSNEEMSKDPFMMQIIQQAGQALIVPGDISGAIRSVDGVAVVRMIKRLPADMADFEKEKDGIRANLQMLKAQSAVENFQQEISRQCQMMMPVDGGNKQEAVEKKAE